MNTASSQSGSHFGKRFLRGALALCALGGVVLALWPLAQNGWARWHQAQLKNQWQRAAQISQKTQSSTRLKNTKTTQKAVTKTVPQPWIPTRLIIPDIALDVVVMPNDNDNSLRDGPGHDPRSALPGTRGNCVIASHRNIYGSYFYRVDELLPGAKIVLQTTQQKFHYTVVQTFQVADTQGATVRASAPDAPPTLTLYTCTIPRSTNRIVVTAQLVEENNESQPFEN